MIGLKLATKGRAGNITGLDLALHGKINCLSNLGRLNLASPTIESLKNVMTIESLKNKRTIENLKNKRYIVCQLSE